MKKTIFLLILVILVASCSGSSSSTTQPISQESLRSGVKEVQVTTLTNAPPEKVYQNADFPMVIQLDNQAAYDLNNVKLEILGIDKFYFQFDRYIDQFPQLKGRSVFQPAGEQKIVEFLGRSGQLVQKAKERTISYFLALSYTSTVSFTHTICINPSFYQIHKQGCQVEPKQTFSGQGAPVSITALEEIIVPSNGRAAAEFRFTITKQGVGQLKKVKIDKASLGGEKIECRFKGKSIVSQEITLKPTEQTTTIICKKQLTTTAPYTTTVKLDLSYEYERKDKKTLRLVR